MPWRKEAKKDAASCEKPRGAASERRSGGIRMGEPGDGKPLSSRAESIGPRRRTQGSEPSQYLKEEKERSISGVAASEMERAQTGITFG